MEEKRPFIVVPKSTQADTSLPELLDAVKLGFKDRVTVKRVVGAPGRPRRLVIEATEEAVHQLKDRFDQTLLIEPDTELKQF
jgi:hypothetical protein